MHSLLSEDETLKPSAPCCHPCPAPCPPRLSKVKGGMQSQSSGDLPVSALV